jgi:hypothetical protein
LPNNIWNINPSDEDKTMRKYIDSSISVKESTLTSRSNELLTKRFIELLKNNPNEYFKKCIYNLKTFFINPFYLGSYPFNKLSSVDLVYLKIELKTLIRKYDFSNLIVLIYKKFGILFLIPIFSYLIGQFTMLVFLYKFFKNLFKFKNINLLGHIILFTFFYQISLGVFAYQLPIYSTNIYLLIILFIGINDNNVLYNNKYTNVEMSKK